MKPFLKWAGGKRWIANQLIEAFPSQVGRYIEPFLGSGAVFFAYQPQKAILSDVNKDLISTYRALRDQPDEVFSRLRTFQTSHSREVYYEVRQHIPVCRLDAAARFIYLNRTCWNGLYRVNLKNQFNVPIGTKTSVIFPDDDFRSISRALKKARLDVCDFEKTIDVAQAQDLIYVDPPYTVKHNVNGFVKYNQQIFSWDDQMRLAKSLLRAKGRGCHIVVSNADHESVRALYHAFSHLTSTPRSSVLAGRKSARGPTSELLVIHHG